MGIDRKSLKRAARANMRGARPSPMLVTLVYLLLTAGLSQVVDLVLSNPIEALGQAARAAATGASYEQVLWTWLNTGGEGNVVTLFLTILITLYTMVLSFGYHAYTLRRTDGEEAGHGTLLAGFNYVGRIILQQIIVAFFSFAWAMLTMLPALLIGSMAMGLLVLLLGGSTLSVVLGSVVLYGAVLVGTVLGIYLTMRYVLAPWILADRPELGAMEAVRRSRALLRGRMGEAFTLILSFLGWNLLAVFIPLVVMGLAAGAAVWLLPVTAAPVHYGVGIYGGMVLGYLAAVPFSMWFVPYYSGTFAQYYRALVPRPASAFAEGDRPEPF